MSELHFMVNQKVPLFCRPSIRVESQSAQSVSLRSKLKIQVLAWATQEGVFMFVPNFVEKIEKNGISVGGFYSNVGFGAPTGFFDQAKLTSLSLYILANCPEIGVVEPQNDMTADGLGTDVLTGTVGTDKIDQLTKEKKGRGYETPVFEVDQEAVSCKYEVTDLSAGKSAEVQNTISAQDAALELNIGNTITPFTVCPAWSFEILQAYNTIPNGMSFQWGLEDYVDFSLDFDGTAEPVLTYNTYNIVNGDLVSNGPVILMGPGAVSPYGIITSIPAATRFHTLINMVAQAGSGSAGFDSVGFSSGGVVWPAMNAEQPVGTLLAVASATQLFFGADNLPGTLSRVRGQGIAAVGSHKRYMRWINDAAAEATGTFSARVYDCRAVASVQDGQFPRIPLGSSIISDTE